MEAQKLFFGYVGVGGEESGKEEDLNGLFEGNFDTINAGPKMEKGSYEKIAEEMGRTVSEVLFLSDNVNGKNDSAYLFAVVSTNGHLEVQAAKEAGMPALVVDRPGNVALSENDRRDFTVVDSLSDVVIRR